MILFVHIPKNGGMSIRRALGSKLILSGRGRLPESYIELVRRAMRRLNHAPCLGHARWRDFNTHLKRTYKAVAVVRNPWSRTVSRYTWALQERDIPPETTFREFLEQRHEYAGIQHLWHSAVFGWYQQKDYVTDEGGRLRCDVLRHRHLSEEGSRYFGVKIGRDNVSEVANYRDYYWAREKKIVADWFAEDIEFFGFTFDGVATKNTVF